MMCTWNVVGMISKRPQLVQNILTVVEDTLSTLQGLDESEDDPVDDLCVALFMKGICLRHLGKTREAEDVFHTVLLSDKRILEDLYVLPFSCLELAFLMMDQGRLVEAKEYLEDARHNYQGFKLETLLHFRVHTTARLLRGKDVDRTPQPSPLPSREGSPLHEAARVNGFNYQNGNVSHPAKAGQLLQVGGEC